MRVVIGTAGHVDHGKTSLVHALTGIDTDRLPDEKRRGITTELGFAHLTLPGGNVVGMVDVPGHERFVRAMAAGAGGIDVALLIVAVDEGVMPQTREHIDICRLLGMRMGVVALTKCDLAAELPEFETSWLPLVLSDLDEMTSGTFLEKAPRVRVSVRKGEGLEALRLRLGEAAQSVGERGSDGPLLLPVDRAFTVKGFGTVVTGTILSGQLAEGDAIDLIGGGMLRSALRVRGLQVHGKPASRALAGQRTAANLVGIEADSILRGAAVVATETIAPASMFDVEVTLLAAAQRPLKHRAKLMCHLGTDVASATVALLDRDALAPGQTAFAQLRLGRPIAAMAGARFILRGGAAIAQHGRTVAGGQVLRVAKRRLTRKRAEAVVGLRVLKTGDVGARAAQLLLDAGEPGLTFSQLSIESALSPKSAQSALDALSTSRQAVLFDRDRRAYVHAEVLAALATRAESVLATYQRAHPAQVGMPREELHSRLGTTLDARLFARTLQTLADRGVETTGELVRRAGQTAQRSASDQDLLERVATLYRDAALAPPTFAEVAAQLGVAEIHAATVVTNLIQTGQLIRAAEGICFDRGCVEDLRVRLVAHLNTRREITTQEFKTLVGQSRKFVIPLSEFFDREKVTLRVGEKRILRGQPR